MELRVWTATATSCVWCGGDGGRGGRRRRIKATCCAHGEKQTRVCVCLIPRGKEEEVPRGRQRGSLGTHKEQRPGVGDDGQRQDAEKRKSPGTVARGKDRRSTAQPASRTHAEAIAQGRGGGEHPGAHCFHPAAHTAPLTHPASTPPTHPAHARDTPDTRPPHARDTPDTHPTHAPTQPRPRHTPTAAGAGQG